MEENKNTTQVLALRPGRREIGVAVLEADELLFWGVAGFRESDAQALLKTVEKRIQDLVLTYQPEVLAIEQPSKVRLRMSPMLGMITGRVSTIAVEAGLRFLALDALVVREKLCGSSKATRARMAERIVELYPHLGRYCRCSSQLQEDYWRPMFSAVGVATVFRCGGRDRTG